MEISGLSVPYVVGTLDKFPKASVKSVQIEAPSPFPRNASEGQLSAIKLVGKSVNVFQAQKINLVINRQQSPVERHVSTFETKGANDHPKYCSI